MKIKRGRPQAVKFTPAEERKLAAKYLHSNKDSVSGSATMAARVFAANHQQLAEVLAGRASKHSLPQAVWDAVRKAKRLVPYQRKGEKGLRTATYTPGLLRLNSDRSRRLFALERVSWDDGTVNFGVCVPWPWGGCKCSEKYGVKLGRFQLLLPHDDATSFIPAWNYVIRPNQTYRGSDVAGCLLRFARDVGLVESFLLEGGNWQSNRVMTVLRALGVNWVDAKGRPECKLVENFFNRLWTRLAIELPFAQVGRFREDDKVGQQLYCDCRAGMKDPRKYYPMLDQAMTAMDTSLRWLNSEPIESDEYGTWVPVERWMADLAEHPRPTSSGEHLWLAAPVCEERLVRRGMIRVKSPGPMGIPTTFHFSSPDLWSHEGERVMIAFDPLHLMPKGTVASPKTGQVLCEAVCVDPGAHAEDGPEDATARAMRAMMRREYRVLLPDRAGVQRVRVSETEIRTPERAIEVRSGDMAQPDTTPALEQQLAPERVRETTPEPHATRADLSASLRRRAARAAQMQTY